MLANHWLYQPSSSGVHLPFVLRARFKECTRNEVLNTSISSRVDVLLLPRAHMPAGHLRQTTIDKQIHPAASWHTDMWKVGYRCNRSRADADSRGISKSEEVDRHALCAATQSHVTCVWCVFG